MRRSAELGSMGAGGKAQTVISSAATQTPTFLISVHIATLKMTDVAPPTSLGKRVHEGENGEEEVKNGAGEQPQDTPMDDADDSDDDVGPMPMPDSAAPRKKRKGTRRLKYLVWLD